jgi:hypothetical protein
MLKAYSWLVSLAKSASTDLLKLSLEETFHLSQKQSQKAKY